MSAGVRGRFDGPWQIATLCTSRLISRRIYGWWIDMPYWQTMNGQWICFNDQVLHRRFAAVGTGNWLQMGRGCVCRSSCNIFVLLELLHRRNEEYIVTVFGQLTTYLLTRNYTQISNRTSIILSTFMNNQVIIRAQRSQDTIKTRKYFVYVWRINRCYRIISNGILQFAVLLQSFNSLKENWTPKRTVHTGLASSFKITPVSRSREWQNTCKSSSHQIATDTHK